MGREAARADSPNALLGWTGNAEPDTVMPHAGRCPGAARRRGGVDPFTFLAATRWNNRGSPDPRRARELASGYRLRDEQPESLARQTGL